METKLCKKCNVEKETKNFDKNNSKKDGLNSWCKKCKSEYNKKYRLDNKDKIKEYQKIKDRERYLKNKDKILQQHKIYNNSHKEEKSKHHHDYYIQNKEKIKKKSSEYFKKKLKEDFVFKMKFQIRNLIRLSFTKKGYIKSKKTEEIIGISLNEFYYYLLKTFEKNYGYEWDGLEKVHIDHIIPLSNAETKEEIIQLCHYKNLQLLKAKDNLKKSNKLDWELK